MAEAIKQLASPSGWNLRTCVRKPASVIGLTLALTVICYIESAKLVPWSIVFTYGYERVGGLLPVMTVHFLVNVLGMILTA